MRVALLGPVEVELEDGRAFAPAGARPRALLARLALDPGSAVSRATLATALWGDEPPAANALHTVVSRLRRSLGTAGELVRSHPSGYLLDVPPDAVDAARAERLAGEATARLTAGDARTAGRLAAEALALWRGEPFTDVDDAPFAGAAATRLDELRLRLRELSVDAALGSGDDVDLDALQRVAGDHPLREHLQVLLVRALYAAGRQADALAWFQRTRTLLADELGVDPSPELAAAHLAILRQDDAPAPRPRASRLPTQITSFVGRQTELADVTSALRASRLVTVVGPGGAGKTRLAAEAARQVEPDHADGAYFVELAPVQDPAELPSVVLTAVGMRERALFGGRDAPQVASAVDRLVDGLSNARVLLVLDNCEHVVAAAARLVDTLLAGCPDVRVLTTSREPLAITGEQLCPLPPLAVPPERASAVDAAGYAAAQLFTDRARAVRPGFALGDDNVGAVTRICRGLDGMPLAVELAAARLRTMSTEQVAGRLGDRFRLLTAGSRTAMPRHQTLLAVVDWSWELLDKPERLLLARLSVFAGPATLPDVEAVCADDELPVADVLDVLTALIDKSLVDATGSADVRYRLLETVRAYASDRLAESGHADDLARRHARHVLSVTRTADPLLRSGEQLRWLDRLDAMREDVAAALRWSTDAGDERLTAALVASVGWYWSLRGMHSELRHWPRLVAATGGADVEDRIVAGMYDAMTGYGDEVADMQVAADQATQRLRELDRPPSHPFAVLLEPTALMLRFEMAESLRVLTDVVDQHEDPWTRATARMFRSRVAESLGDGVTSSADEDEMQVEFQRLGDRWGLSLAAVLVADRHARAGDYERAIDRYRTGVRYMREIGAADDEAQALMRMAEMHAAMGQFEQARARLAESTELPASFQRHLPTHRAYTLATHAAVHFHEGDLDRARQESLEAVAIIDAATTPFSPQLKGHLYIQLADTHIARGDLPAAARVLHRAWQNASPARDRPLTGQVIEAWANWTHTAGDPSTAAYLLGLSRSALGTVRSPNLHSHTTEAKIRTALPKATFTRSYETGRNVPHPAVANALTETLQPTPAWTHRSGTSN